MNISDAKKIDLGEWTLSGGGAQGDSFFHKTDSGVILKLFNATFSKDLILKEFEITKAVQDAGVTCPEIKDLVACGDRLGIIYQRIEHKKSFARAISHDTSLAPDLAVRLAKIGHDVHSKSREGTPFANVLDYYRALYDEIPSPDLTFRDVILTTIDRLRKIEKDTLVHGDFHYGNVITDGTTDYLIDLGTFCYGDPEFDNSMVYYTTNLLPDDILHEYYHIHTPEAKVFWDNYKKAYYGEDCPSDEDLFNSYKPYLLVRSIFFEANNVPADYLKFFRESLIR